MLVICSYRDLTVDHVYRYLLLKGLSFVGRISNYPARRGFFFESFESLVCRMCWDVKEINHSFSLNTTTKLLINVRAIDSALARDAVARGNADHVTDRSHDHSHACHVTAWLVCLIRSVFPGASEEGIRKDYLFSQMVYESLRGWSSGQRGEASPYKYLLSTPPPGRDLSNTIRCLTLKIRNRSRGPVDPALFLLIKFRRVFSAGGAGE